MNDSTCKGCMEDISFFFFFPAMYHLTTHFKRKIKNILIIFHTFLKQWRIELVTQYYAGALVLAWILREGKARQICMMYVDNFPLWISSLCLFTRRKAVCRFPCLEVPGHNDQHSLREISQRVKQKLTS